MYRKWLPVRICKAMLLKYIRSIFKLPVTYIIILLTILNLLGIFHVKKYGVFARLIAVEDLAQFETEYDEPSAREIASQINGSSEEEIRTKLMNRVKIKESDYSDSPLVLLEQSKNGRGMICGGLASIYFNALKGQGYKARMVKLLRQSVHTPDAHQTVEVWQDGGWKISDPTFNVEFWRKNRRVGAAEIQESVLTGGYGDVKYRFKGDVQYPARLDEYYMNWQPLFNNVFVMGRSVYSAKKRYGIFLAKVPPFRYWFGPVYFYKKDQPTDQHVLNKSAYFIVMVALPSVLTLLALWACFQAYFKAFRKQKPD